MEAAREYSQTRSFLRYGKIRVVGALFVVSYFLRPGLTSVTLCPRLSMYDYWPIAHADLCYSHWLKWVEREEKEQKNVYAKPLHALNFSRLWNAWRRNCKVTRTTESCVNSLLLKDCVFFVVICASSNWPYLLNLCSEHNKRKKNRHLCGKMRLVFLGEHGGDATTLVLNS